MIVKTMRRVLRGTHVSVDCIISTILWTGPSKSFPESTNFVRKSPVVDATVDVENGLPKGLPVIVEEKGRKRLSHFFLVSTHSVSNPI